MYLSNIHIFHTFYYCSPYQYLVDSSLHYRNDNFLVTVVLLISVTQAWPTSNVNGVNLPTKAKIAGLSQQCGWNSMEASNCKVAPESQYQQPYETAQPTKGRLEGISFNINFK